jgi:hypothetical protein
MRNRIVLCSLLCFAACDGGASKGRTAGLDGGILAAIDSSTASLPPSVELACSKAATVSCGGSLVGTWTLSGSCSRGMTEQQVIHKYADKFSKSSGQCGVSSDVPMTGYVKFRADGTYQIDEIDGITISYSESCLAGIGQTCGGIGQSLMSVDASADIGRSCQSAGGKCTCTLLIDTGADFGSYTMDGSTYRLYRADGTERDERQYCIQGDVLSVFAPSDTIGGGGIAIALRAANGSVTDIDASIVFPRLDASADAPVDKPKVDAAGDVPVESALRDAQDASVDLPADQPRADVAVDAQRIDGAMTDTQAVDATPLPFDTLPPSVAVACRLAAASPCGGDITGSWKMVGTCDPWLSETEYINDKNQTCLVEADLHSSGTAVFSADGTCTVNEQDSYDNWYAGSCLIANNDSCAARDQRFMAKIGTNDLIDAGCEVDTGGTCHCDDVYQFPNPACTYSTVGGELTFISAPGAFQAGAFDYCVQGNILSLFIAPTSATGKACDECAATLVMSRAN